MPFSKGNIPLNKGKKMPREVGQKISIALQGHKASPEARIKMSEARKGFKFTEESKKKMSEKAKLRIISDEHKQKLRNFHLGRKHSTETKIKIGKYWKGENNPNWNGGITPINIKIRESFQYRQWRSDVFQRDNWSCQTCGIVGGKLQAHHIKSFSKHPELRFELNNGITLCRECHKLTDNYGAKALKEHESPYCVTITG